jgi:hypothetical protein
MIQDLNIEPSGAAKPTTASKTSTEPSASARAAGRRQVRLSALQAGPARDKLYAEHPVTRNDVAIATPPLKEAYDIIESVIVHRDSGTCLLGEFRVGKTTTIMSTVAQLNETFPDLPVGLVLAKGHDQFTQNAFFSDLLLDFNHLGATKNTALDKRLRCLNMLLGQARQLGSDRYLLLVDEGQNWGEPQWTWLRDLANDLAKNHVRLITVTFGQSELRKVRTALISRNRADIVGRFLLSTYDFRGLRDVAELRETLGAFDDCAQLCYPLDTDIAYSEFFMPEAFRGGWRLGDEAEQMWAEFAKMAQRSGKVARDIGMNWIGGAVRNYLFAESTRDGPGYTGSPDIWAAAVLASGYEATLF